MPEKLTVIYELLFDAYGPQHWWPGDSRTEVIVGAILTQNTAWGNVERALDNLKRARCLDFAVLREMTKPDLAELIRPSGTFRVKADRLKAFVDVLSRNYGGSLDLLFRGDLADVRQRLLSIHGIGPETADAILLYADDRPSFVVDTYTKRVLRRHHFIGGRADYDRVRRMFHEALPTSAALFNEYHALFVALGKRHCRARADCEACPLADLPHDPSL